MDCEIDFPRDRIRICRAEQFANRVYILAKNFVERRCIFSREHGAGRAIDLVDTEIGIHGHHSGRNAFQDDLHVLAPSLEFARRALKLFGHIVEERDQQAEFIVSLNVNPVIEIARRDFAGRFRKSFDRNCNPLR